MTHANGGRRPTGGVDVAKRGTNRETMFHVEGMRELLQVLNKLPKELQNEVREASQAIANDLAAGARNAAHSPLQRLAASGIKARRDRVPVIGVGATNVKPGVKAIDVFYGAEFGGGRRPTTRQFPYWKGRGSSAGYFLYPTARQRGRKYYDMWADAVDKAFEDWNHRPI